jgi:hypothetical protein
VNATPDAKRLAGTILEVLAGVRSISDAALLLGILPARYYALEARAIAGLIAACEPRARGPAPGSRLEAEVDRLRTERDRLRDEAARYQALARIAQAAFGPSAAPGAMAAAASGRSASRTVASVQPEATRKKRVATVRALRLAQQVQGPGAAAPVSPSAASTASSPTPMTRADHAGG